MGHNFNVFFFILNINDKHFLNAENILEYNETTQNGI